MDEIDAFDTPDVLRVHASKCNTSFITFFVLFPFRNFIEGLFLKGV
jgi:hypothetical protein